MLAKWLKGVTSAVSAANPDDEHCAFLTEIKCQLHGAQKQNIRLVGIMCWNLLRLRAAVFVNLVAMRSCVSRSRNVSCILTPQNLSILQRANFLLHSALNSCLAICCCQNVLNFDAHSALC